MILNKLMVTPLLLTATKQQHPTPRLLNKNKKITSKTKQIPTLDSPDRQPFNFDDTLCFTQLHKNAQPQTKNCKQVKTKKCNSQILTFKHIYQSPNQRKESQQNSTFQASNLRGFDSLKLFQLFREQFLERDIDQGKFSKTSHSTRRKYSMSKPNQDYIQPFFQRPLSQQKHIRKTSTFIQNKFPYNFNSQSKPTKDSILNVEISDKEVYTKQPAKARKRDFFQFSIIKPDEIKPIALKRRQQERENNINRKKEYRTIYQQMLQQIRRKEEILKRNGNMRQKKLKQQEGEVRTNLHTSSLKRKTLQVPTQQKNEVKPWEVQGNWQTIHNFDIM